METATGERREEPCSLDSEVLIIGAGPAGATLALLLAKQFNIKSVVVSKHRGTANTPRAHIFNQRAMEVLRDLKIEDRATQAASPLSDMVHTSFLYALNGEEYGRLWSFGNDPARRGEYESCSPCSMSDLPQSYLEPILVEEAQRYGVDFRFGTEFLSLEQDDESVRAVLKDRESEKTSTFVSKYLIGADGARSQVLDSIGIPVDGRQLNTALNHHIQADLTHFFRHRPGSLNWILNPDAPDWSAVGNIRMVRPWTEFVVSMHPSSKDGKPFEPTEDQIKSRLHQMIGDDTVDIKILSSYRWVINNQVARSWQKRHVLCIGDATHRHPPNNGLGSNTCIADAFNLAWKLAYVLKGLAGEKLLDTLTVERKPVGDRIVQRANEGIEVNRELWQLLGLSAEARKEAMQTLKSPSAEGEKLRNLLRTTMEKVDDEVQALGIQMNQVYVGSSATFSEPEDSPPDFSGYNSLKKVLITTFPGYHLPHLWLARDGQSERISILDLVGKGEFVLFTGIGGSAWVDAAKQVTASGGVRVRGYSIGFGCDYMDAYRDWARIREVSEDGVVLVRPDHFVAWRSQGMSSGHKQKLEVVLNTCLQRLG